jgi:DNA-binding XRE family transcriptional regulator
MTVSRNRVHVVRRRVDFPPPTPQPTPCVLWQGSVDRDGYGRFKRFVGPRAGGKRLTVRVTRWVMEQALGRQLRPEEFVLHACDNPPCFRVDHLSVGTAADNNRDMRDKGRGTPPPLNRFEGECHPMAKLSARQVRAIRGHYLSGLTQRTIAEMFDVSPQTISKIIRGVLWKSNGNDVARLDPEVSLRSGRSAEGPPPPAVRPERNTRVKPHSGC